jgi:hypothetical protein
MRFITMVKATESRYEAGMPPSPELMAAIGKLGAEMTKAGVMLSTEGLHPTSKGARVRIAGGKLDVIDGPFAETKELIGGYAILKVRSKEEAIELSKRFMQVHADVLGPSYVGEVEIRQLHDASDPES